MNTKNRKVKRFEIYLYDFGENAGSIQCGRRPVLILQDDRFNENSPTTIVAALTTAIKKEYLPSHIFVGERFGLKKPSMVLLEQIRTVNQNDLLELVGVLDDDYLIRALNRGLKKTFGLWNYNPKSKNAIRCLCPTCVHDYMADGSYIVRRLDPFQKEKNACEKCKRPGWDYIITERKTHKPDATTFRQ